MDETPLAQIKENKMKKIKNHSIGLTSILFSIMLFQSCATVGIDIRQLTPQNKNSNLLPALEPRIDMHSLESAFSMGQSIGVSTGYAPALTKKSAIGSSITSTTMSKDPRVQDVVTLFDRDVKNNITNPYGDKKGYKLCKIAAAGNKTHQSWAILHGLFLMIPTIIGVPIDKVETMLDVEVEIYDKSERLIRRYNSQCKSDPKLVHIYYGYFWRTDAQRATSIEAFKCAIADIKNQIENDAEQIITALNN